MDCLVRIRPDCDFPWFDDYREARQAYKVYNDGSHYVATKCTKPFKAKRPFRGNPREKWHIDELFDESYRTGIIKNLSGAALRNFIKSRIEEYYPDYPDLLDFINKCIRRKSRSLYMRCRRFRRKAYNYAWSYMVTFTYDDKKMDETLFRIRLKRRFAKLTASLGWRIMGAFERGGNTDRLHFHGIVYVPDGKMIGELKTVRDFSVVSHHIQETQSNSYFSRYFGRNDFKPVSEATLRRGGIEYILKDIEKGGERIYCSRGIKSEFEVDLLPEDILGVEITKNGEIYYIYDDVLDPKSVITSGLRLDAVMPPGTG